MESEKICDDCGLKYENEHIGWKDCVKALKSRISSFEAALSLDPENVERVAAAIYESESSNGKWADLKIAITRQFYIELAKDEIPIYRKLAGLEVSDGE